MSAVSTPAASADKTFVARGIAKTYRTGEQQLEVLRGVDLELGQGEMVAVVGASGCGKTTLLHILGTLDRPTGGTLHFGGENIFAKDSAGLALFRNRTVGFVFQFHHLLPEFTALENVMMPGFIAGSDQEEIRAAAHDLLARVGLAQRASHRVGELSGGEQQRVALARAMIMQPSLLLADEPTGNLDLKTGRRVFDLLQEINATYPLATVMVTHNPELAGEMDRCLTLTDGVLHG